MVHVELSDDVDTHDTPLYDMVLPLVLHVALPNDVDANVTQSDDVDIHIIWTDDVMSAFPSTVDVDVRVSIDC